MRCATRPACGGVPAWACSVAIPARSRLRPCRGWVGCHTYTRAWLPVCDCEGRASGKEQVLAVGSALAPRRRSPFLSIHFLLRTASWLLYGHEASSVRSSPWWSFPCPPERWRLSWGKWLSRRQLV
ncbi:hypothetical protein PYCCODRAFT_1273227 [Trametes coccinea BRFM310]|uniref:Uncharacterized protein n=1 Tax=Trametes coccinea (strain BRFM310) TaxID=1353009 RepID=A0A1Y2IV19_TRAC3|nr:hypothetical protein PYCCODRAFT_1273227 [Trametes coccinea BRFM310]